MGQGLSLSVLLSIFDMGTLLDPCPFDKVTEALESYVYPWLIRLSQVLVNTVISSVPKLGNVSVRVPEVELESRDGSDHTQQCSADLVNVYPATLVLHIKHSK